MTTISIIHHSPRLRSTEENPLKNVLASLLSLKKITEDFQWLLITGGYEMQGDNDPLSGSCLLQMI